MNREFTRHQKLPNCDWQHCLDLDQEAEKSSVARLATERFTIFQRSKLVDVGLEKPALVNARKRPDSNHPAP
jgi:hypothetical protein